MRNPIGILWQSRCQNFGNGDVADIVRQISAVTVLLLWNSGAVGAPSLKPDLVVSADGSGDFSGVQAAVASISTTNRERTIILIKNGVYREKIRVDAPFVTFRGESRNGTRIEFPQLNEAFQARPDNIGRAVINLAGTASDFVLDNLSVENTAGQIGPHAFTIYGKADRTVIVNCDVLSDGADTVSLWRGDSGRYYHANCRFRGSVDFVCPRGWCYVTNCSFFEMKATAAVWHDGSANKDMKFVLRDCRFDGTNGWNLARHHHDAQFYFLDCTFAETMRDQAPFRVIYPLGNHPATEADIQRNAELDKSNLWGERAYFYDCHREGGDYAWMANNLTTAPGSPKPEEITPAWTFADKWNPEATDGPRILRLRSYSDRIELVFSESVTVKGQPRLVLQRRGFADYATGSGTDTLTFSLNGGSGPVASLHLNGGAIIATEAGATLREAETALPTGPPSGPVRKPAVRAEVGK